MTAKPNPFKRLWTSLKERHVTRIALAYLGVGWGVLETLEFTLGLVQAPDWIFRAGVALVGLGFPVALILSWVFDIRGGQVVRTDGKTSRWSKWVKAAVSAPVLVLVVVSSYWVWTGYVEEKERSLRPTDLGDEVPIVAVLPIRNLTGDPELDWFGEGIVNLVRDNLSRSRFLRIASPQKLKAIVGDATDELEIAELAAEQDIGFIMAGEMLMTPAGIYVSSRLTDTAGGVVLSAKQVENLEPATILEAAGPIAAQIRRGLGVPREEQVDVFVADFAIDNQEAYEQYVDGLVHFTDFEFAEARQAFLRALEIAPDFGVARYRLAYIEAVEGDLQSALNYADQALLDPFLLDRERRYIEAFLAYAKTDNERALELLESLLDDYPYELEAREMLARVYRRLYRLQDAVREFELIVLESPANLDAWAWLGTCREEIGDREGARAAFERLLGLAPDNPNGHLLMGNWLKGSGEFEQAELAYAKAREINPQMPGISYTLAEMQFLEGDVAGARLELESIARNEALPIGERLDGMFGWAALLAANGDFEAAAEAITAFEEDLEREHVSYAMGLSRRALYYMELGQNERAKELVERSIEMSPGLPTRYLFARAQIELMEGRYEDVARTVVEIRSFALPPDNPDRTEEAAAAYLEGLSALRQGNLDIALERLSTAVRLQGYRYALYELPLIDVLTALSDLNEADVWLKQAVSSTDEHRFDLEKDRVLSLLMQARLRAAQGLTEDARRSASQFLEQFQAAPPNDARVLEAKQFIETKTFGPH